MRLGAHAHRQSLAVRNGFSSWAEAVDARHRRRATGNMRVFTALGHHDRCRPPASDRWSRFLMLPGQRDPCADGCCMRRNFRVNRNSERSESLREERPDGTRDGSQSLPRIRTGVPIQQGFVVRQKAVSREDTAVRLQEKRSLLNEPCRNGFCSKIILVESLRVKRQKYNSGNACCSRR